MRPIVKEEGKIHSYSADDIDYTIARYEPWSNIFDPFAKPGKYTLDIGAGQSDIAAIFRERGAIAFAVDPAYLYLEKLDEQTSRTFEKDDNEEPFGEQYHRKFEEAREKFRRDHEENSGFYIPASAENLPLKSNSFDLVFSGQCISTILSRDYEKLEKSVKEVRRVLKPTSFTGQGGLAVIFPFDHYEQIWRNQEEEARIQQENLEQVLRKLKLMPFVKYDLYEIPFLNKPGHPLNTRRLLTIQKTPY